MVAQVMIGRIFFCTARVSHPRSDDAAKDSEPGVRPPESAQGERRGQGLGW
jgi:hypothetical protein